MHFTTQKGSTYTIHKIKTYVMKTKNDKIGRFDLNHYEKMSLRNRMTYRHFLRDISSKLGYY